MDRLEFKADLTIDEAGRVEGMAWPFGSPDRVGDVIEAGAFSKAVAPLPMLDTHDLKAVIGVWDEITETAEGLRVKGRLLVDDVPRAREVHALVKSGAMRGLSVGFRDAKAIPRERGGRSIQDLDLFEISICAAPVHTGAQITSAKDMSMADQDKALTVDDVKAMEDSLNKLTDRLDKIEAKSQRAAGDGKAQQADEVKAFAAYLSTGATEGKALTTSSDTPNHILAPEQIESEFLRNLVEFSPIRTIADVRGTTSAKVILPKRTGITNAVWVGETQARTGSEPSFDQADIDMKELATYVDISLQMAEDSANVLSEVNLALSEDFGQKESLAFVKGSAALEPSGFMADADIETLDNGHVANIDPDALISLLYSLPQTYRNAGTWVMNGNTLAAVRKLKDGDGRYLWQPSYQAGQPETILGRPVVEAVDMPDIAEDAQPIIYGDFKRGYRIYDRLSLAVLADPYSVRVNGLVRYHARRRVGADVVRPTAFRKLVMAV